MDIFKHTHIHTGRHAEVNTYTHTHTTSETIPETHFGVISSSDNNANKRRKSADSLTTEATQQLAGLSK